MRDERLNSLEPRTLEVKPLIETHELAEMIGQDSIRVLDATYFVPPSPRNALAEYQQKHLPGALFFDIDRIAEPDTDLPHMLPAPEDFAARMGEMGISNQHHVVIYDTHGLMSAPRAWWMFRVFGHHNVSVLNGGLPKWERENRALETEVPNVSPETFTATMNPALVKNLREIQRNMDSAEFQLLDLRSAGRFWGRDPEPRQGLRGGHVPGSLNLTWNDLVDPDTKTLLPVADLKAKFEQSGLRVEQPIACSCGSGVTACMGAFGLYLLGNRDVAIYDGAWAEWGANHQLPVETGQPLNA